MNDLSLVAAVALLAAGGAAGATRFAISRALDRPRSGGAIDRGVLTVNLAASAWAGGTAGLLADGRVGPTAATIILTGACGGLSTFSTVVVDTIESCRAGQIASAVATVAANVGGGFAAATCAYLLVG